MLPFLEQHQEHYQFILSMIKKAINTNAKGFTESDIHKTQYMEITGLLLSKKYEEIISYCDGQLNLFQAFGLKVIISNDVSEHDEIYWIV